MPVELDFLKLYIFWLTLELLGRYDFSLCRFCQGKLNFSNSFYDLVYLTLPGLTAKKGMNMRSLFSN